MENINTEKIAESKNDTNALSSSTPTKEHPTNNSTPPESKHYKAWWFDIIVMVMIFFSSQMVGIYLCNELGILPPQMAVADENPIVFDDDVSSQQAKFTACVSFFAMILCLIVLELYRRWRGFGKMISFRTPGWASPFRLLCAYILMWCFSIVIEPIAAMLPTIEAPLGGGGWLLISAVFIAPLFEEIVFRGYIAGTLRKAYGVVVAWLTSSLFFGLAHGAPDSALSAAFIGLILCYCYFRYRSLVMVIMLHAMNNLTACFLHNIGAADSSIQQIINNNQIYWVIYALCLSVSIIAIARMWQNVKELESDKYLQ